MSTFKVGDRIRYHNRGNQHSLDMVGRIGTVTKVTYHYLDVKWEGGFPPGGCYPQNAELVPDIKVGDMVWIRVNQSRGGSTRCDKTKPHKITGRANGKWFIVDMNYYAAEDLEIDTMSTEVEKALALLKQHGTVTFVPKFKPISMDLNDQHEAVIHKDHVKVGCQTFRFDRVLMLAEMVKKVQAEQR